MAKVSSHTNRIPVLYLRLYERLVVKYGKRNIELNLKDILESNKRALCKIPYKDHYPIVQEMVHYKLFKKINNQKYELIVNNYEKITEPLHVYFLWD